MNRFNYTIEGEDLVITREGLPNKALVRLTMSQRERIRNGKLLLLSMRGRLSIVDGDGGELSLPPAEGGLSVLEEA